MSFYTTSKTAIEFLGPLIFASSAFLTAKITALSDAASA